MTQTRTRRVASDIIFVTQFAGRSTHRTRINDRAPVTRLVHRADAEEIVVLRHTVGGVGEHVADIFRVGPFGRRGIAPDDLVAGDVGVGVGVPLELGVVGQLAGDDADVDRFSGRVGQAREGDEVNAGDIGRVFKIDELRRVAVKYAILGADVLVLVRVVLVGFGNADGRKSAFDKRYVVATAAVSTSKDRTSPASASANCSRFAAASA